ncbi:hypothetical protein Veis_4585 [Verminephrobacter eiseniae EF01-2]|uniref:Uncharacterized protein n=1 Tax=Verminephrobacter eiseniae (strain EF01-2) TaxID=391735 RepID=A1WRM6_VEREI|nr:hypothetical protein Veis_4585 [Verminephrobacter eiseniae EF01-2]
MKSLAVEIREPFDAGGAPLAAVHGMNCLRFLEEAHAEWKKMPARRGRRSHVQHLPTRRQPIARRAGQGGALSCILHCGRR